jgi:hypothetical protein
VLVPPPLPLVCPAPPLVPPVTDAPPLPDTPPVEFAGAFEALLHPSVENASSATSWPQVVRADRETPDFDLFVAVCINETIIIPRQIGFCAAPPRQSMTYCCFEKGVAV